ncbi:MAG TPA: DedA family protein [Candidatus Limnocylindrales bacterium]|nr:DedA family protein [Candidatus Limnocylindrales bacterium]
MAEARSGHVGIGRAGLAGWRHGGLRHPASIAAIGVTIGLGILAFALLEGDIPEALASLRPAVRALVQQYGHGVPFGLLYLEESGVPMPVPGDVFVMYVGHHASHSAAAIVAAWLAITGVVVLGASTLYLLARRFGRRMVERRLGSVLHLTPARLDRAERWFERRGAFALIFGRHVPGCRVPLTVAAGIFRVRYPVFALSVAVSTATWSAIFLAVGIALGGRIEHLLRVHHQTALLVLALTLTAGLAYLAVRLISHPAGPARS